MAEYPEVGTVSQGYTIEEAIANLKEATELYLEEFPSPAADRPLLTTFEAAVCAGGGSRLCSSVTPRAAIGTLRGILRQANVDPDEFMKYL